MIHPKKWKLIKKKEETSTDPIWKNTVNWHLTSTPLLQSCLIFMKKKNLQRYINLENDIRWNDMHVENEE